MTDPEALKVRADVVTVQMAVRQSIMALARDGIHPYCCIEGALLACVEAGLKTMSLGQITDWLRDAADQVEALALGRSSGNGGVN